MAINYDAIVKRARKAIERVEARSKVSDFHFVEEGADIDNLIGLVVIKAEKVEFRKEG